MRLAVALAAFLAAVPAAHARSEGGPPGLRVSSQGLLSDDVDPLVRVSPRGSLRLRAEPLEGDLHQVAFALVLTDASGAVHRVPRVRANGFLATDAGAVVAVDAPESNAVPTRLTVLGLDGAERWRGAFPALTDPVVSADGTCLAFRTDGRIVLLDLATLEAVAHPDLRSFVPDGTGRLAGTSPHDPRAVVVREGPDTSSVVRLAAPVVRVAFARDGRGALALTADALWYVDPLAGEATSVFRAPPDHELRDLRVAADGVHLGARQRSGGSVAGRHFRLGPGGAASTTSGPTPVPTRDPWSFVPPGGLAWPLSPDAQHPVGNTYGEFQDYGGSPYLHPGVDVLGSDGQPVFAVADGVVKAVLTTSGPWHWRVATGEPGAGTSTGYLYAHLDAPTIAVNVGDTVAAGQYLGDLVPWPVAGFTHVHFARIEDTGAAWSGSWLCTDNPHVDFTQQGETEAPVFEDAVPGSLFAFCDDETSNYRDPTALTGRVDIVVHVGDRLASTWVCAVQEIRYTIHPAGDPGSPVVDDRLAVDFDMALDTYQGGPIDPLLVGLLYKEDATCDTDGDYASREFFHIVTNSNGDSVWDASDAAEAWDTTLLSDGDWVIRVTARDAAGNASTASMTVTTANGNP